MLDYKVMYKARLLTKLENAAYQFANSSVSTVIPPTHPKQVDHATACMKEVVAHSQQPWRALMIHSLGASSCLS